MIGSGYGTRRQFGKRAALAAGASAFLKAQQDNTARALPPADQAAVDSKYANVIRKYGARLSSEQRARVRTTLAEHQRMLMRIRDFALENGDAPATGLRLYPSDVSGRNR